MNAWRAWRAPLLLQRCQRPWYWFHCRQHAAMDLPIDASSMAVFRGTCHDLQGATVDGDLVDGDIAPEAACSRRVVPMMWRGGIAREKSTNKGNHHERT